MGDKGFEEAVQMDVTQFNTATGPAPGPPAGAEQAAGQAGAQSAQAQLQVAQAMLSQASSGIASSAAAAGAAGGAAAAAAATAGAAGKTYIYSYVMSLEYRTTACNSPPSIKILLPSMESIHSPMNISQEQRPEPRLE